MPRHLSNLSNPYYWLFGFILGLITGALVVSVLSPSFRVPGETLASAMSSSANEGSGSSAFPAEYAVQFIEASGDLNTGTPANSQAKFKFTLDRALSDDVGAFTSDKTVSVALVRVPDDAPMGTRFYGGSGGVLQHVVISQTDPLNPFYETRFRRGDLIDPNTGLAPTGPGTYVLKVHVRGVDGDWMLQATSNSVTF